MRFEKQKISDLFLITPELHSDHRGVFRRSFCENEFKEVGLHFNVVQANISENHSKHTLRGFHYQKYPSNESKLISCISGSIFNVVIDLRDDSETFLALEEFNLSSTNKKSLYIPAGCANAFLTLEDNTIVNYYMGDYFNPNTYSGFRYDDPLFSIDWPFEPKFISDKDLNFPNFIGK